MSDESKFIPLGEFISQLQALAEQENVDEDVPVMVRKVGHTADYIRQVTDATAVERLEGTPNPPVGQFHISEADEILKFDDLGRVVILIT